MGADAIALALDNGLADRASGAAVRGQSGRIRIVVGRGRPSRLLGGPFQSRGAWTHLIACPVRRYAH